MDADWSVELGADDPVLEFPWVSADGSQSYVDLTQDVGPIDTFPEVVTFPLLHDFLCGLNGPWSPWFTAKCDAWCDDEISEAEEIYGGTMRMCSYVDLIRRNQQERFSFEQHERWVKLAAECLHRFPQSAYCCEFIVRRCYYHLDRSSEESRAGFYVTAYAFGYGDEETAQERWKGCLDRVCYALTRRHDNLR